MTSPLAATEKPAEPSTLARHAYRAVAWAHLGLYDIRAKYRRTILGPLWVSLTTGMLVVGLVLVYAEIFRLKWEAYLPYLAAGIIVWSLIARLVLEGSLALVTHRIVFSSVRLNPFYPVVRVVVRAHVYFLHDLAVFAVLAAVAGTGFHAAQLLAIPAFLAFAVTGVWVGLVLGLVSARFRDVQQFLSLLISVLFLLTPVLWTPDLLGDRLFLAEMNPLTHYVAILREPLLGNVPSVGSWLVVLSLTLAGSLLASALLRRALPRFIYWL